MSEANNFFSVPTSVKNVFRLQLPSVSDQRGRLIVLEKRWLSEVTSLTGQNISFERFFCVDEVPAGTVRGNHAHKNGWQIIICLHGTVDIFVSDGNKEDFFVFGHPDVALLVGPMVWIKYEMVDPNSVILVICSENYDEEICIKDREEFDRLVASL